MEQDNLRISYELLQQIKGDPTLVHPLRLPDRPLRKCTKCGTRTTRYTCAGKDCNNKQTIIVSEEGRL